VETAFLADLKLSVSIYVWKKLVQQPEFGTGHEALAEDGE
jgi:hypothetical protein